MYSANVSVIIPVYNVEPYLKRCLDALCNQTLKDIEIICINDCSTDSSILILEEYAQNDSRVKIVDFKENRGVSIARNAGIEIAKGEYIGFVDPDDYVDLDFYEKLFAEAKNNNSDIVKGNIRNVEIDGKITVGQINKLISSQDKFKFQYEWTTAIYRSSVIYNNNIKLPEECTNCEDIVFLIRCLIYSQKVSVVEDAYYNYCRREKSLNSKNLSISSVISTIQACEIILDELNQAECNNLITNKQYIETYLSMWNSILFASYRNDEYSAKEMCVEHFIENFYKCKYKDELEKHSGLKVLIPYIKNHDKQSIINLLSKYQSPKEFVVKNILSNLRNNVKKDIKI